MRQLLSYRLSTPNLPPLHSALWCWVWASANVFHFCQLSLLEASSSRYYRRLEAAGERRDLFQVTWWTLNAKDHGALIALPQAQGKERQGVSTASSAEEARKGFSPRVFRGSQPGQQLGFRLWSPELWQSALLLFQAIRFVVISYGSPRKLIRFPEDNNIAQLQNSVLTTLLNKSRFGRGGGGK